MDVCVISLCVIDIFHFGKTLEFKLAKSSDFNQRILCENDCPNLTNFKEKKENHDFLILSSSCNKKCRRMFYFFDCHIQFACKFGLVFLWMFNIFTTIER